MRHNKGNCSRNIGTFYLLRYKFSRQFDLSPMANRVKLKLFYQYKNSKKRKKVGASWTVGTTASTVLCFSYLPTRRNLQVSANLFSPRTNRSRTLLARTRKLRRHTAKIAEFGASIQLVEAFSRRSELNATKQYNHACVTIKVYYCMYIYLRSQRRKIRFASSRHQPLYAKTLSLSAWSIKLIIIVKLIYKQILVF